MTLTPAHTFVNGTAPDANELQAVLDQLFNRANRTKIVGESSSSVVTRTLAAGLGSTNGTIASKTFDVDETSSFAVGMSGVLTYSNKNGAIVAVMELLVDGTTQLSQTFSDDAVAAERTGFMPISAFKVIGLTAGSHTIAIKYTLTVSRVTGTLPVNVMQAVGGSWGGLVMPA